MALFVVVLPVAITVAEEVADRLETAKGPSTPSRILRTGAGIGRRVARR